MNPNELIEASAGTGKTQALAERLIALVAAGVEPQEIVALTFSRAAAGEIFERFALQREGLRRGGRGAGDGVVPRRGLPLPRPEGAAARHAPRRPGVDLPLREGGGRPRTRRPGRPVHARRDGGVRRARAREAAVIRRLDAIELPRVEERGREVLADGEVRDLVFWRGSGMPLPGTFFVPTGGVQSAVLLIDGKARKKAVALTKEFLQKGQAVLVLEVSGYGESCGKSKSSGTWTAGVAAEEGPAMMAYLLGKSLVGMRAEDILVAARWLSTNGGAKEIEVVSRSWGSTPVLHAAASTPGLFARVRLVAPPPEWREVVAQNLRHRISDIVFRALYYYTMEELYEATAAHREEG